MSNYHITWEIDVEAGTPRAAAEYVWTNLFRQNSTACVFDVRAPNPASYDELVRALRSAYSVIDGRYHPHVWSEIDALIWRVAPAMRIDLSEPDPWASDAQFPVSDWQTEVANGDTRLGYLDWVEQQREENEE